MRLGLGALAALLALGCGDDDSMAIDAGSDALDAGFDAGPGCATYLWSPGAGDLSTFPDPDMVVTDPSTPTGVRLQVTRESHPIIEQLTTYESIVTDDYEGLDGFGINAGAFLAFGGPFDLERLPSVDDGARGVGFVTIPDGGEPRIIPAEVQTFDLGATLHLIPQEPLPEASWAAVFVLDRLVDATESGCLETSDGMRSLLEAPGPELQRAIDALTSLEVISGIDDLVALQAFPTQTVTAESVAVADAIFARDAGDFVIRDQVCEVDEAIGGRHCTGTLTASDYRDADGVLRGTTPTGTWDLTVESWLPAADVEGPYATLLYQHGLTGSAEIQGPIFASASVPRGIAIVAVSALLHQGHPTAPDPPLAGLDATLAFLAADPEAQTVQARRMRDHFRQTTFDRLQVTRLLQNGPDLDGDGEADVDVDRLGFLGTSLGAVMGPELLSLTDAYPAAVLAMPGGGLSTLITDEMGSFGLVRRALIPPEWPRGLEERIFPLIQTAIERADAASYGPHVFRDRLRGAPINVYAQVAVDDGVVTNASSWILARAMRIGIVPRQVDDAPGLVLTEMAPFSLNIDDAVTAGLQQFDRIPNGEGAPTRANHINLATNTLSQFAWWHFLETYWETGVAEIVDPYEELDFPHRDEI